LEKELARALREDCRVTSATNILVCVSGGLDSIALLHLLAGIQKQSTETIGHNIMGSSTKTFGKLEVVTFNHKLRPEADEEVKFVQSVASSYGLVCHERTALPHQLSDNAGLQARARKWRGEECCRIIRAARSNIDVQRVGSANRAEWVVATAHHADDQLETLLLKLLRGAHISAIHGIQARNGVMFETPEFGMKVPLIRPLLGIDKASLKDYLISSGYEWREDASNLSKVHLCHNESNHSWQLAQLALKLIYTQ